MSASTTAAFGFSSPSFSTNTLGTVPSILVFDQDSGRTSERFVLMEGPSKRCAARMLEPSPETDGSADPITLYSDLFWD